MITLIVVILLIKFNFSESHWNQQLRYKRSSEQLNSTQSLLLNKGLDFDNEPEILTRSENTINLKLSPIKQFLRNQTQAYFVIVENVSPNQQQSESSSNEDRNYTFNYRQSVDNKLNYYTAIKLTPDQLSNPIEVTIGNDDDSNNYLNPPLKIGDHYRFGLAALMDDNTFRYVQSSRSILMESSNLDLIKTLIVLFGGLIIILLVIIAGLVYYLREIEVDVRWQDVVMIWSKRHRSSLFKDRNRSYRRCEENRMTTSNNKLSPNKYLSGTNRFHTNSYINMEVEHHLIDIATLIVSITDPSFKNILQSEYNGIPFMQMPTVDGTKSENRKKNRYVYLPAFDFNRVKLIVDEDEIKEVTKELSDGDDEETDNLSPSLTTVLKPTDYINASYIDGYNQVKSYIATQGPLNWTFNDFWKMMWQQDSSQIVMLTGVYENGRIKCDKYWPDDEQTETYGRIQVKHISTNSDSLDYVIRKFIMTKGDESKEVIHYHYINWPDHGAPADPDPLLNLIETINHDGKQLPSTGPIVTHCSAGVGRTGTYILTDIMLKMGEAENSIDSLGQLYLLRKQRTHMIETEEQYYFVHQALARYFTKKSNSTIDIDQIGSKVEQDKQTSTESQLIIIDSDEKSTIEP